MTNTHSVLVVEDEPAISEGLTDFLEFHGFQVTLADDGLLAERLVDQTRYDLILLDLMLPKISGEQLCTRWRTSGIQTPIIMLTAKGLEREKIAGLNLGADDYLTKPFSLEELLARIHAILRRTDPTRSVGTTFAFGDLTVDISALTVTRNGRHTDISKRESEIIRFLAANPNRVISRQELYETLWQESFSEFGTRTVDMHIAKLRSKIERDCASPHIIQTVRGAGYRYHV